MDSASTRVRACVASFAAPTMSPCCSVVAASRSRTCDDLGGVEDFEGLGATRLRADFSRFLVFLLLGFVFAIVSRCESFEEVVVLWGVLGSRLYFFSNWQKRNISENR